MERGDNRSIKRRGYVWSCIVIFIACLSSACQRSEQRSEGLAMDIGLYQSLFEEEHVEAELIQTEEEEYLQLTFSDGSIARYKDRLVYICQNAERTRYGEVYDIELEIRIIDEDTASVNIDKVYRDGRTAGGAAADYRLPDLIEIVSNGWEPSINDLAIIRWISREEIVALYEQAKSMEEAMEQCRIKDKTGSIEEHYSTPSIASFPASYDIA